jgi:hypothetical protein
MIWVWLLLVIAGLFGVVAWVGSRLPKTHTAASRIQLAVAPEEVWRVITDFSTHPNWRPGLQGVEIGPEIEGLPSWYEVCARNMKVHFRVVESDPPRRLVTRLVGEQLPLMGSWIYDLTPISGGTEVIITEQDRIFSPFFRVLTKFVFAYHGVMDVFLIALARTLGQNVQPEHLSLRQGSADGES